MDYLTDIKPLEDAGKTDAETAEILATITNGPISPHAAKLHLRDAELWEATPTGYDGKFQVAFEDATHITATIKSLTNLWSAVFTDAADTVETELAIRPNGVARGSQQCLHLFKALGRILNKSQVDQADIDDFYNVGGGLKYPGAVEQDVIDSRAAYQAELDEAGRQVSIEAVRANIENTWINPALSDGVSTAAEVIAAIKAGL